ncbi:uncharacterized protein [Coffea arabica]|uniref:Reverse transcriptase domain-containing protein n=1 Tax=Coffea arabica TaxID=13443 RepID=A0ABM4W161_COFAR
MKLQQLPSLQELKEVVFSMSKDSVPGSDGFGAGFYQACWSIIQNELLEAVQEFFKGVPQPRGLSSALIVLVPKEVAMPKLDVEIGHGERRTTGWNGIFLFSCSAGLGGGSNLSNFIQQLVFCAYQWGSCGVLHVFRGVRQGDPLSPALFLMVAEFLGRGLVHLFGHDGNRFFVFSRQRIPYLAFADDTLIFTRCAEDGLASLKLFFDSYQAFSSQKINPHKSSFFLPARASREHGALVALTLHFQQ